MVYVEGGVVGLRVRVGLGLLLGLGLGLGLGLEYSSAPMWCGERSACSCACRARPSEVGVYGGAPTRAPGLHCRAQVAQAPLQSPAGPPCAGAGVPRGAGGQLCRAARRAIRSMRPRMQPCDLVQAALDHPTRIHQQHHLPRDGIGSSLDPPPCVPPHVQGRTTSPTPCMRIVHAV